MRRYFGLIIYFLICGVGGLSAQNVMFFGSKQGLSHSCVRNISEDSRHNIWLTTQNGLNRYDGVKMNVYRHEMGNETSLMHDESTCVFEYKPDKMLIGTGQGVQLYDYATDRFSYIPFLSESGDTLKGRTVGIYRIQRSRVMVCFAGYGLGELKQNEEGQLAIERVSDFNTRAGGTPVFFFEDGEQRLWMADAGRHLFLKTTKGFRVYGELTGVRNLCMSSSGRLYAATYSDGIFRYDKEKDRFDRVATADAAGGLVYGIRPWTMGRMFVCTDGGGLRIYDEQTGLVTQSAIAVKDFDFATSNVEDAMHDSFGHVWVAIYRRGVMMKPVNQAAFEYVGQHSITKNTIGSNAVYAVAKAMDDTTMEDGGIWVASDNDGLYRVAADGRTSTHFSKEPDASMPHSFTSVYQPDASTLLLGTFSEGLWQMRNGHFSLLTKEINQVFDIHPAEENGCFWIATMGHGFFYYRQKTGDFIHYDADWSKGEAGTKIIGNPYVYAIRPVQNRLFVGTADGLTVCHLERNGIIREASEKILDRCSIRHIIVSADGAAVWVATNQGLAKVNRKTLDTRLYTTEDGLPTNSVESLSADGDNLWIGTDFGLSCMDVAKDTFTNFFSDDGLQDNEFSRAAVLSMGGKLYFGGIGGLTYFDTNVMKTWRSEGRHLRLRLVDVFVGGKAIHKGDMSGGYEILQGVFDDCARIDVCHTDNHFTFELCVEGLNNQHVSYEYSINGGAWIDQGGSNERLVFDNLEPGTYRIRVRAHAFGTLSEEREIVAVVHPAWYASMWAKMVYLLIFLLICWLIYEYMKRQYRIRKVMAHHRQQQELNEARVQFFMNISHEIRTPMTLILAPLERLIGMDKDAERQRNYQLIKQNSKRILRLINQMMDVRKIEQGKFLLDYHRVELVGFLQNIFDVFVTNAQSRNITYEFVHDMDSMQVYIDPDNTDKIVMNLLSNAFKFTPDGGKITMMLTREESGFEVKVTDSGVGIKDEDKPKVFERFYSAQHQNGYMGTGIGLNLTSMLVKLHKGTIVVNDNPEGTGAQFVVKMPIGDSDLCTIKPEPTTDVVEEKDTNERDTADFLTIDKPADTHRRNAVLVEDDEAIRQYVHSELSKDLVLHSCGNGQEAWDYIMAHPGKVDVVISDIMMPVMDGMTLCQKLKANFTTNHIPIVLMTALGSDADRIAGMTNGADAYVSKPFNIDVLRTTILQLMKTRQLLQGKYHGDKQQEEKIDRVELESPDEHLMRRVMKTINENMDNPDLSVEMIADKVGISRVHFYRKMKDLTGQAPRDFVKYVRLKEAARLLSEKKLDITGVSIATGFKSLSAFSTNFKALYGLSPTEWVKKEK